MQQGVVQVEADAGIRRAEHRKLAVEIVGGNDTGKTLHGAKWIGCQHRRERFDLVAGESQFRGACSFCGAEGIRRHVDGVGAAKRFRTQDNLKLFGFILCQRKYAVEQTISHGLGVQRVISGGN